MKPKDDIKKFYEKASVTTNTEIDKTVLNRILKASRKTSRAKLRHNVRSIVMKKPMIKLAAAAVVVWGIMWLSVRDGKINVLSPLSAQQLIELHYDSTQTTYDPELVKKALKQALEQLTPEQVIALAKNMAPSLGTSGGRVVGPVVPPAHPIPEFTGSRLTFSEVVEESNLMVHARLVKVDINVDNIVGALLNKAQEETIRYWTNRYPVTIQLDILDVLPEKALETGQTITVNAAIYEAPLLALKVGTEYFIAMVQDARSGPKFLDVFTGIYPVDHDNPVTPEFWKFFADAQDILLFGNEPN